MKFSNEHYEGLKAAIASKEIDLLETKKQYDSKGLSEARMLWDLFWFCGYSKNDSFRAAHYKDSHIETAIRKAVSELTHQSA